jgi:hypothetical protein
MLQTVYFNLSFGFRQQGSIATRGEEMDHVPYKGGYIGLYRC